MQERGRIVAIDGNALWVETIQQSTCGSCSAQKGCGQGLLNKLGDGKRNHIRVLLGDAPASSYKLGEQVEFSVSDNVLLKSAAIVYLLPLLAMLAGMGLTQQWSSSQGLAAIGALLGFVVGFLLVRLHSVLSSDDPALQPRVAPKRSTAGADPVQVA